MYEELTGILEIPYLTDVVFGPSADIWGSAGGVSAPHPEGDTLSGVDIIGWILQGTDAEIEFPNNGVLTWKPEKKRFG